MKVPYYETSAGALLALLGTKAFVWSELYSIFLADGSTVLRYCTNAINVRIPSSAVWSAKEVLFKLPGGAAGSAHWKSGVDVDTWQVNTIPRPSDFAGNLWPDQIGGLPWVQAIRGGALDGAEVQIDRAYFPAWPVGEPLEINPTGVVTLFYGRVAAVDIVRTQAIISINSHLELLSTQMPRNSWQSGCRHTLFDTGCQLVAGSFVEAATADAGSTQGTILSSVGAPGGSATYTLGRIVMTSGLNTGFSRTVRKWTAGTFTLIAPLPFSVAAGDTFDAYPGCDKTQTTCTAFSNLVNFGGEPYVPVPETAI